MPADNEIDGQTCPICGSNCVEGHYEDCVVYTCDKCGKFKMNNFGNEPRLTEHHKFILKCYYSTLPPNAPIRYDIILTNDNIDKFVESINYPKSLVEKVDNVLAYFVKNTQYFGQKILIADKEILATKLFCRSVAEFDSIIEYLCSEKYLTFPARTLGDPEEYTVTMAGIKYYQEYEKRLINNRNISKQAFVAMWFNSKETADPDKFRPDMQTIYSEYISSGISDAGYKPLKIDCKEHCNDINDEMISEIRKSRFMVADLTGYRGGVYWEAGFAYGLGLDVIYTCHKKWQYTDKELEIEGIHFDLSHRNIIFWDDTEEGLNKFRKDLKNRIEAVINIKSEY